MYLMNLMNKKCMTRADLSMMSGVPDSTLRDILSGKAQIDHCEAATIYGIADALGTTVEDVLDHYWDECLRADDEECEREVLHDGHTLLLFYSTVDRVVQLRQHVDDALLMSCVNSEAFIDLFFDKVFGDDTGQIRNWKYFSKFRQYDELHHVLLGRNPGREDQDERILSYNYGLALHDIVYASRIYDMISPKGVKSFDYSKQDLKLWV